MSLESNAEQVIHVIMNREELLNWLFEKGGPAIRYRTMTELVPQPAQAETGRLRDELTQSRPVKACLEHTATSLVLNDIHGSKAASFENIMGKLTDLGLTQGFPELDRYTLPYRNWLSENAKRPPEHIFDIFARTLVAAFLARAGYNDEPAIGTVLKNRLETIYSFIQRGDYEIYVDSADYPKMPGSFQKKPLINPALSEEGNLRLPWIYDILGLAAWLPENGTESDRVKANTIIEYILDERYQKLYPGYGVLRAGTGGYYAMGWDVRLPGFFDEPSKETRPGWPSSMVAGTFVQRLILMGQFPAVVKHAWFIKSINHLSGFQTENGTYLFPRSYLQEKPVGYWVTGARMGLEENRRKEQALALESTFRMAKLLSPTQ